MNKFAATLIAFLVIATGVSACGANDADVGGRDTGSATITNMPDHFSSIAIKCDGPNRIYESDHGNDGSGRPGALAVVPNDPRCKGSGR